MLTTYTPSGEDQRTQLIKGHLHMVSYWVERMVKQSPPFMSRDEIKSAAMEGLINAANRFDPEQGVLFKTFAEYRIRGAIYDEIRRLDWFSRSMRDKQQRLTEAIRKLEVSLGRAPTEDEIARDLGLEIDKYYDLLGDVSHLGCLSLQEAVKGSNTGQEFLDILEDEKGASPREVIERSELAGEVAKMLEQLSEKEQQVIALIYNEDLSQKEVAEVLELTEGRISQLHSQALAKLRVKMEQL